MKKVLSYVIVIILLTGMVNAQEDHDFTGAMNIIDDETPCSELSQSDLEQVGEYYMEQMHPGEAHVRMDEMMGGEGSENLKNMHINMGLRFYCEEEGETNSMMGGSMMMGGSNLYQGSTSMMGLNGSNMFFGWFMWVLLIGLIVFLVVMLVNRKDESSPMRTLKNRYAKGEISNKEYHQIKKEL